jgi:hypothetical protein
VYGYAGVEICAADGVSGVLLIVFLASESEAGKAHCGTTVLHSHSLYSSKQS